MYYSSLNNRANPEPLEAIKDRFEDCLSLDLEHTDVPVLFKKDMPDRAGAIRMGKAMLKAFYESVDLTNMEIVEVELPLSATLFADEGQPTDFKLVGVIDLVLRDQNGELIIVDNKTASKPMTQVTAGQDNQMTAYAYLLCASANKYVFPTADVRCRFDLLRKLQTPKVEQVYTSRTAADRKRFARISNAVLAAIDAQIFLPQPSWMCSDCAHSRACQAW